MNKQEMDGLLEELEDLQNDLWHQRNAIRVKANEMGIPVWKMQNADGSFVMIPLLKAQVEVETTIALIKSNARPNIVNISGPTGPGRAW